MLRIDVDQIPALPNASLSANCGGLIVRTRDGKAAKLAVVDEFGAVLESGDAVEKAAWMLMLLARRNFLEGLGHIKVFRPA